MAGDLVRCTSVHGSAMLRALITDSQREGEGFAPMHWTDEFHSGGPIGGVVSAACDPVSGQPELKATPVQVEAVPTAWRGVLLRRRMLDSTGNFYSSRIPLESGHAFHLSGWEPLPDGEALREWVGRLLGQPEGAERLEFARPDLGTLRFASIVRGQLDACLLIASKPDAVLPDRAEIAALLGCSKDQAQRSSVLGARGADGSGAAPGATICACYQVGLNALRKAIAADNLTTVAEIGAALRAGTSCGSCVPELAQLLREQRKSA
jgi:assimilatory nitrate reductase catalytic subunit